jgi:hypothetical protein
MEVLFGAKHYVRFSHVRIEAMDALLHHCIATMIVRIYGSLATQWISGGQLRIMQRVLGGEIFSWGLMLHAKMMGQINRCQVTDSGEFSFGSILVAWFLERVPMLHPRVLLSVADAREPRLMQVGIDFGMAWRWGGWPLFYRPIWHVCGTICHRLYCSSHMVGWTSGMTQIWFYLLERIGTIEVCWCTLCFVILIV